MDLSFDCDHGPDAVQDSGRRGLFFLHPDLHDIPPVYHSQQTDISSCVPSWTKRWSTVSILEIPWTDGVGFVDFVRCMACSVSTGGSLLGLDHSMGWAIYIAFMVSSWKKAKIESDWSRSLAYQFILDLHWTNTILPIVLPTTYLWIVDTLALQRGTWAIESGTKLNWYLWRGLDLESVSCDSGEYADRNREAVFFLVTNVLIVFGLTAFDNALAVLNTFPDRFESRTGLPSPLTLVKSLLLPLAQYDQQKIDGLREALARLKKKSRSFYLASGVFEGQLRVDLILLYSFCRVADDLVDNARTTDEARSWIEKLKSFLTMRYRDPSIASDALSTWLTKQGFSTSTRAALMMLPTTKLSPQPLHDLLQGFRTDLKFGSRNTPFPILDGDRLELYAMQVAGTVAELCIELVFHHTREKPTKEERRSIIQAGGQMGIALQCVNIARDIIVDAHLQRVYLPTTWLKDLGLRPEDILKSPESPSVEILRNRLLDKATELHDQAAGAIDRLPSEACGPIRVAVECYMEIGKTLRTRGYKVKAGRATVPKIQSLRVAWIAMRA